MPPPPRRDPFLSGMAPIDAEVLDAEVLDAEVLDAEVLDAEVLDAEVLDAEVLPAESVEQPAAKVPPLELDDGPAAVFDLDALDGAPLVRTTPAPPTPVVESQPPAPTGADLLSLDVDPPPKPTRMSARPATATRPAVRITFVCPGEQSPFGGRG
ncbi:hypothetical protein [Urbifossiella limnaea]|uniref:Uncharacterized protein n=1 Tax=Urbifossiella limnaea TaxID=2528023 RepID=A0A517XVK4_9BACT|nr:hypothetical protein [Urbifossiella limnaea]QDU21517.1 hypothetical protein ETAA1_34840 [Urbifossiella limnaea]